MAERNVERLDNTLRYGDTCSIFDSERRGYVNAPLTSESNSGVVVEHNGTEFNPTSMDFSSCLFQVVIQDKYRDTKEFNREVKKRQKKLAKDLHKAKNDQHAEKWRKDKLRREKLSTESPSQSRQASAGAAGTAGTANLVPTAAQLALSKPRVSEAVSFSPDTKQGSMEEGPPALPVRVVPASPSICLRPCRPLSPER